MPVNLVEPKEPNAKPETTMPPPRASRRPAPPLFRDLEELRSGHRIGGHARERVLHLVIALAGAGVVFGILYTSMLVFE